MDILKKIKDTYPELDDSFFTLAKNVILLSDDGDGVVYISKWDYDKPIPAGLKLGK